MCDANRGIRGVHTLAARPAGAERVDTEIFFIDLNIHLFCLRQNGDGDSRGMDAAARFGGRYTLNTMDTALVLQLAVYAASLDCGDDLFQTADSGFVAREHLEAPTLPLGILAVHPKQLRGEKRGLVASR